MNSKSKISWQFLFGNWDDFKIEHRAFNAISIFCAVLLFFAGITSVFQEYNDIALWCLSSSILSAYLFFLARFRDKYELASIMFAIASYVVLIFNYYINSGITGPTTIGFVLSLMLLLLVTKRSWHKLWLGTHLILVPFLYFSEQLYPESIIYNYKSKSEILIDQGITYILVISFIALVANFLRLSYLREKKIAQQASIALKEKNKELANTISEKDRLFSIIAHDLRSPLNSISSYLEVLAELEMTHSERDMINKQLLEHTQNTSELLNNLLNWSVKKNLKYDELKPVKIRSHFDAVLNLLRHEADKKNIEILCNLEASDHQVLGESEMVYLIIRNLVNNGIKFTHPEGQIKLEAEDCIDKIKIKVSDNGVGITEEKKKQIFNSNIKPTAGTNRENGVGLGLTLCHDFAKAMGGNIDFSSKENVGSEFVVTLNKH